MIPVLLLLSTALTSRDIDMSSCVTFTGRSLRSLATRRTKPCAQEERESYGNAKGSPSNCAVDGSGEPWPGPYKWQRTHLPGPTGCTPGIDETQTGIR
jgi:hypothetical protein